KKRKENSVIFRHIEHVFQFCSAEKVKFLNARLAKSRSECVVRLLRKVRRGGQDVAVRRIVLFDSVFDNCFYPAGSKLLFSLALDHPWTASKVRDGLLFAIFVLRQPNRVSFKRPNVVAVVAAATACCFNG